MRLDLEQIKNFLQTFQILTPLSTGERAAFPLMLRLDVLEFLAGALAAVTGRGWDSKSGQAWEELETSEATFPI